MFQIDVKKSIQPFVLGFRQESSETKAIKVTGSGAGMREFFRESLLEPGSSPISFFGSS